jgi:serine/threonine-protein kinase HipA
VGSTRLNNLFIWVDNEEIATLSHNEGSFELIYTAKWISSGGYPISPHLPLGEISRDATVKNFFSNLLPEGKLLEGLSKKHQVSKFDVFGLLKKVGRDCAGALVIADTEQIAADDPQGYEFISDEELNQQIIESRHANVPLTFWGKKPRMSLAGVQNKLGVYVDSTERLLLPLQSQPTSHILKIGNPNYASMEANEYFCMQLAQEIGLTVPDTRFRKLPEPVLLVHRYDREWTEEPGIIKRRHQIDACQTLNLPPNLKYQEPDYEYAPSGATLADIVGLAKLCDTPSVAQITILNWILFNYLIGNTDAHAKNLSFLVNRAENPARMLGRNASINVAPFYDLVSGSVYGLNDFAQRIGNEDNLTLISARDWHEFAKQTGVASKLVKKLGEMLIKKMTNKLDQVVGRVLAETSAETSDKIVSKIGEHIRAQTNLLRDSLAEL